MLGSSSIVILDALLSLRAIALFVFKEYYHSIWILKFVKGVATDGIQGLIGLSVAQVASLSIGIQRESGLGERI